MSCSCFCHRTYDMCNKDDCCGDSEKTEREWRESLEKHYEKKRIKEEREHKELLMLRKKVKEQEK